MAEVVWESVAAGNKLIIFGNGGSAADAQHLAAEFIGRYRLERPSMPALALADSSAALTAIANDYDYSTVFSRMIEGLGAPGDVALGISTSGQSANVAIGLDTARKRGLTTMAFTGASPGALAPFADFCLSIPASETARVQEGYMVVGHTLCELVEAHLASPDP